MGRPRVGGIQVSKYLYRSGGENERCRAEEERWLPLDQADQLPDETMDFDVVADLALFGKKVGKLNSRQRKILKLRFFEGKTFEESGKEIGVTRARAFQIQNGALRRLRRLI